MQTKCNASAQTKTIDLSMHDYPYENYPLDASVTTTTDKRAIYYAERMLWRVGIDRAEEPYFFDCARFDLTVRSNCMHPGFLAEVIDFIARVSVCLCN